MAQIGMYLMMFGAGSMALNLFGYEFVLLMWLDHWGTVVGWGIRAGATTIGLVMWLMGDKSEASEAEAT